MSQTPSVGRIVHYVSHGTPGGEYTKECRAAIITAVHGPAVHPATQEPSEMYDVDLCVLNPTGMFFNQHCVEGEEHLRSGVGKSATEVNWGGTWHWPERI